MAYTINSRGTAKPSDKATLDEFRALQRQANRHLEAAGKKLLVCDGLLGAKTFVAVKDALGASMPFKRLADDTDRFTSELSTLAASRGLAVVECPSSIITRVVRPMPKVQPDGSVTYETEGLMGIPYWAIGLAAVSGVYAYRKKKGAKKPLWVI
jgi:hypothetical protein